MTLTLAGVEPRITAAVFGLLGHESLADATRSVTVEKLKTVLRQPVEQRG